MEEEGLGSFIMRSIVQLSCCHISFQQPSDLRDRSCIPC